MNVFDALYSWWYVPVAVVAVFVLLKAGYELWDEAEQARKKAQAQLQEAEREREELRQENEELIAEQKDQPSALPDTLDEWIKTTPLITVADRTYRNERVELDGFSYVNCVFINPTFSFKGEKPFTLPGSRIEGYINMEARGPQLQMLLGFLRSLGVLHPKSEHYSFDDGSKLPDIPSTWVEETTTGSENQPVNEDLRQRCCELSTELFEFLKEREQGNPMNAPQASPMDFFNIVSKDPEKQNQAKGVMRYNKETRDQYDNRFGPEVTRLLDILEQRGRLSAEKRQRLENPRTSLTVRIRRIAEHLYSVCHNS